MAKSAVGAIAVIASGAATAAIPMPDPIARVPLVGLLPRWTWDPSRRQAPPPSTDGTDVGDVAVARAFVVALLTDQGETVARVSGYRLDEPQLVAVVAEVERRDVGETSSPVPVAFTVRVTPTADGDVEPSLVLEDR